MYDLADHTANQQNTWQSSRYSSRIDYIWAYHLTIQFLTDFSYEDSLAITNSDYKILVSKWSFSFAFSGKLRNKANTKQRIFNYKKNDYRTLARVH